ncbi:MAG: MBL fold metallo-hydrolase [Phycisphaerales bacterium]|nr:MBL fold metallo-hydrolase [Phycisphaerales bacterium]
MPARGSLVTVEAFPLGPFETNCYLVYRSGREAAGSACWVVDAGYEPGALVERVRELRLSPRALILTHTHADHIAGVDEVRDVLGVPVWVHEAEASWLTDPMLNLSAAVGLPVTARPAERSLCDGEALDLAGAAWRVLHTPGHSPGGISLYQPESRLVLAGDALFSGSVGRTDFPGSDPSTLAQSIRLRLYTLPDDTTVYPGHGPETTIGVEKRSNPFVRA